MSEPGSSPEKQTSHHQPPHRPSRLGRRPFLKAGFLGGAALTLGGVGWALKERFGPEPVRPEGLKVFTAEELRVLSAVADRICPALGEGAPGAVALGIPKLMDAQAALLPKRVQGEFKAALGMIESPALGALLGERVTAFTKLSAEAQDDVLRAFRDSSIALRRSVFVGLRGVIAALYYADERTWERMGYGGPPSPASLRTAFEAQLVDLQSLRAGAKP